MSSEKSMFCFCKLIDDFFSLRFRPMLGNVAAFFAKASEGGPTANQQQQPPVPMMPTGGNNNLKFFMIWRQGFVSIFSV